MPFSIVKSPGRQILKLEGAITIVHSQEFAARLGEGLDNVVPVEVQTGTLEDIDTSILQLLCSLSKTVNELRFDHPSDAFLGAVDRCGLRRELMTAREIL